MDCEAHVRSIAHELDNIAKGITWFCPQCGEEHLIYSEGEDAPECPDCHEPMEQMTMSDWFNDRWYNCEVMIDPTDPSQVKWGRVMVACGGPNIWVNTGDEKIQLFWWGNNAETDIEHDTAMEVNDLIQDYWQMQVRDRMEDF